MSKALHIIIAEPSRVIFEGLSAILSGSGLNCTFRHISTVNDLDSCLCLHKQSVVIVNPALVQHNPRLVSGLRSDWPETRWIAFVYNLYDNQLLSLFDGVIGIGDSAETISGLISRVQTPDAVRDNQGEDVLSDREKGVLQLLALGKSNKEIADKLSISINTVITHRKNISQKTGIRSVSGLTIYAVVNKLITLDSVQ
ncbi:MAG: LuxR C-terminal-related transcriptional regulator [Bacteroidales bacterium]